MWVTKKTLLTKKSLLTYNPPPPPFWPVCPFPKPLIKFPSPWRAGRGWGGGGCGVAVEQLQAGAEGLHLPAHGHAASHGPPAVLQDQAEGGQPAGLVPQVIAHRIGDKAGGT